MIFAGIDVNIITHPKALSAGPEALGLWTWGMCYAQLHETDGRLPRVAVMSALGAQRRVLSRLAVRLVTAGLWDENEDGSFTIHNYGEKNQTADEIRRRKTLAAERTRRWRDASRASRVTASRIDTCGAQLQTQTQTQTPPDLKITAPQAEPASPTTKRGTRLPEGWTPSAETQEWSKAQGVTDPTGQILSEFVDYWRAVPGAKGVKLDWDATFRNRVRQVAQRSPARGPVPRQPLGAAASAAWMKPEQFDFGGGT